VTSQVLARRPVRLIPQSTVARIGLTVVGVHILLALVAPLLAPYSPVVNDPAQALLGPSWQHWAGTDQYGRDVLSRVLYGGQYALTVSFAATACTVGLGTLIGAWVAYRGGWVDNVAMRVLDAVLSVPPILTLLVIVTVFGAGMGVIVLAVTVVYTPAVARVVRAAAQGVVPSDYVTAARARGERTLPVLGREVLPNILDVVCVEFAMRASWAVLLISSLSFLGFGVNPPAPDWGLMVSENRTAITVVPMASLAPILALASLVVGLNLAADGLSKAWGVDRIQKGTP
jgi:peptide/nickel transport system permease protein